MSKPVLLDVTRTVGRCWNGRTPSGIDRVCQAYVAHFGANALAVLQLRGRAITLDNAASRRLFAALDAPVRTFRRELAGIILKLPRLMVSKARLRGATYINVGHSDFDLRAHKAWIKRHGMKPVYLLHDLIPITHPHVTTGHKTARHRGRVMQALTAATGIIVNSQTTADDLRKFAANEGLSLPPLLVAPLAGSMPAPRLKPQIGERLSFVFVGTIEKRKNQMLLLQVWSQLLDRLGEATPDLVLVGSWGLGSDEVRAALQADLRLRRFVKVQSGLPDAQIAERIAGAHAVLLPTQAEGFGLSMVEAMHLGVPVIASDIPSFREIGQSIPLLLNCHDARSWTEAICEFCANGPERQRQLTRLNSFRAPNWADHFTALAPWLSTLRSDQPGSPCTAGNIGIYKASSEAWGQGRATQC